MKKITESLKFRDATYPQLKKLPTGVYLVKQQPYSGQKRMGGIYSAHFANGKIITLYAGNSNRSARKNALREVNGLLREVNLIYGNEACQQQYKAVLN